MCTHGNPVINESHLAVKKKKKGQDMFNERLFEVFGDIIKTFLNVAHVKIKSSCTLYKIFKDI